MVYLALQTTGTGRPCAAGVAPVAAPSKGSSSIESGVHSGCRSMGSIRQHAGSSKPDRFLPPPEEVKAVGYFGTRVASNTGPRLCRQNKKQILHRRHSAQVQYLSTAQEGMHTQLSARLVDPVCSNPALTDRLSRRNLVPGPLTRFGGPSSRKKQTLPQEGRRRLRQKAYSMQVAVSGGTRSNYCGQRSHPCSQS
ncbi:hypothetical protein LX36DRAFT_387295 [Colletotrichum falcatum]|nr:hypothetical protein LX36DRAFT_387295 [Colletotrichum falcatum]